MHTQEMQQRLSLPQQQAVAAGFDEFVTSGEHSAKERVLALQPRLHLCLTAAVCLGSGGLTEEEGAGASGRHRERHLGTGHSRSRRQLQAVEVNAMMTTAWLCLISRRNAGSTSSA